MFDMSGNRDDAAFIIVEGNIGAGKSTFCNLLGHHRNTVGPGACTVFPEPVHKPEFKQLLGDFYKDQERWAFAFQMYALKERYRQHLQAITLAMAGVSIVQDRSIYADSCFGATCHENGQMNDIEWGIYCDTFGLMKKQGISYPDAMIYLRTNPEECKSRMDRRNRPEEEGVPIEYLNQIHAQHERLAADMGKFIPVIIVEWDYFGDRIPAINDEVNEAISKRGRFVRNFRLI